tara:strand:- start:753 stop:1529 length:777 start_codon:yes stop_codon:yes gene_type:complete
MDLSYLNDNYDFTKLPDVKISTISACCILNATFDLDAIYNNFELNKNNIISIKHGSNKKSLEEIKKKHKRVFYNQLTLELYSNFSKKKINLKLFKNGSIQMCGCKHVNDCIDVLEKLIENLNSKYYINEDNIKIEKSFIESEDVTILDSIDKFKITLINSNFSINFSINREKLYNILIKEKMNCRLEPCIHACVNIKYDINPDRKPISIFVFQSGSIIITGAKFIEDIISSYAFITEKISKNKDNIIHNNINDILKNI